MQYKSLLSFNALEGDFFNSITFVNKRYAPWESRNISNAPSCAIYQVSFIDLLFGILQVYIMTVTMEFGILSISKLSSMSLALTRTTTKHLESKPNLPSHLMVPPVGKLLFLHQLLP